LDPFFPKGAAKQLDMRPKMVRRHKIQVVYPFEKKRPDFGKNLRRRNRTAVMLDRDLIVLAEKTLAGTAAEEDRAGTSGSREGGLLSEVRPYERNSTIRALPAETRRAFRPVGFAIARTPSAILISIEIHARGQFPITKKQDTNKPQKQNHKTQTTCPDIGI
jgi:hypothetical protein